MGTTDVSNSNVWRPESERDTAWPLFHKLFMCRVNNLETMSVQYLQTFGIPSSGDYEQDKRDSTEMVVRMLTINQILEFFKNGSIVRIVKLEDTKIMYELISDHLNAWKVEIEKRFNTRGVPIDDLLELDKLATAVYKHAAPQFTTEIVDSIIARKLSGNMRVNRSNILIKPKETAIDVTTGEPIEQPSYPPRQSMADVFIQTTPNSNLSSRWK